MKAASFRALLTLMSIPSVCVRPLRIMRERPIMKRSRGKCSRGMVLMRALSAKGLMRASGKALQHTINPFNFPLLCNSPPACIPRLHRPKKGPHACMPHLIPIKFCNKGPVWHICVETYPASLLAPEQSIGASSHQCMPCSIAASIALKLRGSLPESRILFTWCQR